MVHLIKKGLETFCGRSKIDRDEYHLKNMSEASAFLEKYIRAKKCDVCWHLFEEAKEAEKKRVLEEIENRRLEKKAKRSKKVSE